ncbi:hypothetical protein [Bacteroides sp. GM023]|uniref:hypothetical protein n=1 Tax=Bacteroides sp. GM023 TaxID=2723058 RepID=UPI00168AAB01|nr:hypothetical protein [Bacteroides sp. GM023]
MAILSNGKFYGFLCSAKETGQKLANGVKEYVEDFVSGFAGHGWKLWEYMTGKWKFEIDTIVVRETMLVFEMLISKIRAVIGAQAITQGHGKVKSVRISDDSTEYLIVLEDEDMSIVAHDFVRCQTFTDDKTKLYHVEVSSVDVETKTLHVLLSEFDKDESGNVLYPPVSGDELVQFGNSQNKARQSAIYMHADETGQPAIDVMFDIDSKNWENKVKVRMGGNIPGGNGVKGFYSVNGMVKAVDDKGAVIYELSPDGSVNLGKGNIVYNPTTNKVTLGSGVIFTWNNLDDESKTNLKGKPGDDGLSIIWKGELDSPPNDPAINWVYRDTKNGIAYIFDGIEWVLMVIDGGKGSDGKSVYITHHDSEEEPERPVGDGTTEGWHTDSTASVTWISQKVAESADSGEWGKPINIKGVPGKDGQDANLLPWIEKWNGYATELGEEYIVTPKMFSGTKSADGKLTGIAQGKDCLTDKDGKKRTGIFALVDSEVVFELDPINKQYEFRGKIVADSIIMKESALLSSAVFKGEYLFSQQGVDADGNETYEYENFNPNDPQSGNFSPNLAFNLKTGDQYSNGGHVYGFATNTPILTDTEDIDIKKVAYSKVNVLFAGKGNLGLPNDKKFDGVEFLVVNTTNRTWTEAYNIFGIGDTSSLYTGIYYKGSEIRTCFMRQEGSFLRLLAYWTGTKLKYYVVGHSDNFVHVEPVLDAEGIEVPAGPWFVDRTYINGNPARIYYPNLPALFLKLAIYSGKMSPNVGDLNFTKPT